MNYLAIVAAAAVSIALGGGYVFFFQKQWLALSGVTEAQMKANQQNPLKSYGGIVVANLAMAFGLAYFVAATGVDSFAEMLLLTFWSFVGFVGPLTLGPVLWEGKSVQLWLFNNAINIVCVFAMVVILALWR
jgi:hypothetical protein